MSELVLGIDAGLTATKAALFTPDGEEVAVGSRETPTKRPASDHREVQLSDLWEVTTEAVREVLDHESVDPKDITAVGVAGHGHGLYLLDESGSQVRPGIKSTDSRAAGLTEEWEQDGTADQMRERLGYAPFAADPLSLLGWLDREEPDTLDRIEHLLFCKDYLKFKLTDRICTDEMEGSVFYGAGDDEYDRGVFAALDVDLSPDVLPEVVPSWEPCGRVTQEAADETGLPEGVPVASGLHDVGATALGTGAHAAGQAVLILGTWGQSIIVLDDPWSDEGHNSAGGERGLTRRYLDGGYIRYKGLRSAAVCLDWFVREFGHDWQAQASDEGVSPYEIYDRVAAAVPAGASGLLFHPYLDGSTDEPTDRGGFYGLTSEHTRADMLRSVYEGVAIAQSAGLVDLTPDVHVDDVRLGGGGARSEVWSDVFAAAVDNTLLIPAGEETGARGAAICGAIAADVYPDHKQAVDRMVSVARHHEPDPDAAALYSDRRETFENALSAIRPTWKRLMNHAERTYTND
ncbi:carbohydrate kinase [Haloarcula sp. S1AR25-5A]|uniref:Carbohydrate kinase n=1 Tax=Haloarcula terrestris TaxID=2950533 RepID=A0AAE4F1A4_9EURY|nr:FGGY-family carbohydrate kinase [Haloarcula terrestris]MDS0222466.1 carbohydrate kinase [Haloarcula terrestris]